jgi:hypothetical protein
VSPDSSGRTNTRRPARRLGAIAATVLLLVAGAVVTATAAPGPSTDVKTAQYGSPLPKTTGVCAVTQFSGPGQSEACEKLQDSYKKAKKRCAKKKSKPARKACLKKVEGKQGKKFKAYVKSHKQKPLG